MWNADYPYLLTITDGELINTLRFVDFGEAVAMHIELLNKPVEGVTVAMKGVAEDVQPKNIGRGKCLTA